MPRLIWPLVLVVAAGSLAVAPSPPSTSHATHGCASAGSPAGPFDLLAYEAADWRTTYRKTLEFAAFNQLFPELSSFALPPVETGPRSAGSSSTVDPYAPPVLLKAIAWIESGSWMKGGWQMADASVDYGEVGPPLVSHSCAYGIMQVLSGMQNTGSVPTLDQVSIGSHYGFNIARGARILAEKWNYAPTFRPIVGSRNPSLIEDWYYAIWSYHGFTWTNHPLNPNYSLSRGVYRCDGTQSRSSFPYQELVLGCVANPPVVGGTPLWDPQPVTLPNLADPAFSLANWNACSGSYQCSGMDIGTPSPSHTDSTGASGNRTAAIGLPALSVNPLNIILMTAPGGQSEPVTITIANSGTGPLAWRLSPGSSWMRYSPRFNGIVLGSDIGSQPSSVTLWADASGLPPSTYTSEIRISSLYPQTTKRINVTLIVGQRAFVPGIARN